MAEEIITVNDGTLAVPVVANVDNGPSNVTIGSLDVVTIGDGQDTITAKNNDTIKVGNGPDIITIGDNDSLTVGSGPDTITAGNNDKIVDGNGTDTITAGSNSNITDGNGPDHITAGPNSTIVAGNGQDVVHSGHDSNITLGSGTDTAHAGTTDDITFVKAGQDNVDYDGLTPAFTVPASITMNEEQTLALPITILPPNLGNEVVNGFKTANGIIAFDTNDFANASQVFANAAQSGANVVITQPGGGGTVTITNTSLSSLSAANFAFFTGATDIVNITGLPSDANLSAGTNNGGGSWTLTPAQLSGLTLTAGEPSGDLGTPDTVTVTITNPSGQGATLSHTFPLVVNAIPPTQQAISVIPYETGDQVTETRLQLSAATDSPDSGADNITKFVVGEIPTDVTLGVATAGFSLSGPTLMGDGTDSYTITANSPSGSATPELDVFAPAGTPTDFTLTSTAYAQEPNSPLLASNSETQNIDIAYSTISDTNTFSSSGQSIWDTGNAFNFSFNKFFGLDYPSGFPTNPAFKTGTTFLGTSVGATLGLKAGFQTDLNINGGSFNGSIPFTATVDNTWNKTNGALEIDPSNTEGAASFNTTGPGGNFYLAFILDAMAAAHVGSVKVNATTNITKTLVNLNTHTATFVANLPDDVGSVTLHWPELDTTGSGSGAVIPGSTASSSLFQVNLDPFAILSDIVTGGDVFKGGVKASIPLGFFTIPLFSFGYTLLQGTVAPHLDMQQMFSLFNNGVTPTLTASNGTVVPITLGSADIIPNASSLETSPGSGTIDFNLNLSPNTSLGNDTGLEAGLLLGIKALGVHGSIAGAGGHIGPFTLFSQNIPLGSVSVFNKTFPVTFASQKTSFSIG